MQFKCTYCYFAAEIYRFRYFYTLNAESLEYLILFKNDFHLVVVYNHFYPSIWHFLNSLNRTVFNDSGAVQTCELNVHCVTHRSVDETRHGLVDSRVFVGSLELWEFGVKFRACQPLVTWNIKNVYVQEDENCICNISITSTICHLSSFSALVIENFNKNYKKGVCNKLFPTK